MTQKAPGVFIEEKSVLPPSVAQVETAIPAFLGYTERAEWKGSSLHLEATAIASLKEYEFLFGGPPSVASVVTLDSEQRVSSVDSSQPYLLHESLRLFFDNGGGRCYIISLGGYPDSSSDVSLGDFEAGLAELALHDEPTLIVAPDAILLGDGLYQFQKLALMQCETLGDRFAILDLRSVDADEEFSKDKLDFNNNVAAFRNNIGIAALKYGAAYAPYLKSTIPKKVTLRNLTLQGSGGAPPSIPLETLVSEPALRQHIFDLKNAIAAVDALDAVPGEVVTAEGASLRDEFDARSNAVFAATGDGIAEVGATFALIESVFAELSEVMTQLPAVVSDPVEPATPALSAHFSLATDIPKLARASGLVAAYTLYEANKRAYDAVSAEPEPPADPPEDPPEDPPPPELSVGTAAILGVETDVDIPPLSDSPYGSDQDENNQAALRAASSLFNVLTRYYSMLRSTAGAFEATFEAGLETAMGTYKTIKEQVQSALSVVPPSGPLAGVYARTDATRGVWKAPANVSLNSIAGPVLPLSAADQESLNVDPTSGKSINVIRTFTGRGTLVWGARTLAGNDNEWRYVNVRRFFNMVEESCKKATEPFVFEPNDANTWVRVQAMIENFLTTQWRVGALQGATPGDAFYVAVGLGKTMTAVDILEGRMIVETGLAVVRPAEFITLRFTHKLAVS